MERNLNEKLKEESINREREDKSCSLQWGLDSEAWERVLGGRACSLRSAVASRCM